MQRICRIFRADPSEEALAKKASDASGSRGAGSCPKMLVKPRCSWAFGSSMQARPLALVPQAAPNGDWMLSMVMRLS
eukprot:CAMPEP_0198539146 /NCGR_PEP_ID=MMETSP1462-20131121/48254_1 /TAXON_ID=1333877 /ORGANISM="Brandtodinium nutriculum, Strain RCC3387" /LENGTH=76 /DNA_ID=CAMNT_0044269191 /DNA_START=223 /DNA_END=450 /DNA_ORIENTATION=+